uniref:TetR family transcriptional regulator n=1 Tax=uncultured Pseudomonadota bacterium TaxID=153809 RepID=R4N1D5_9PROT|nr:TetR family transcriptional regulator [uncultured proteobacterium]
MPLSKAKPIARSTAVRKGTGAGGAVRRGRNSAEATEQLLLEAAKAAFVRKGYVRTTVQDIIEGTGLSRGAFYRHFRSTDDVFMRVTTAVVDELVASSRVRSGETLRERVYASNHRYLEIFAANRGAMHALFEASYVNPEIAQILARMRGEYLHRVRDHLVRQCRLGRCLPIDPDSAALSLGLMVESAAQAWAVTRLEPFEQRLEIDQLCEQLTEIWCRSVYLDPDCPQQGVDSASAVPAPDS